jgi:hypothetical protein
MNGAREGLDLLASEMTASVNERIAFASSIVVSTTRSGPTPEPMTGPASPIDMIEREAVAVHDPMSVSIRRLTALIRWRNGVADPMNVRAAWDRVLASVMNATASGIDVSVKAGDVSRATSIVTERAANATIGRRNASIASATAFSSSRALFHTLRVSLVALQDASPRSRISVVRSGTTILPGAVQAPLLRIVSIASGARVVLSGPAFLTSRDAILRSAVRLLARGTVSDRLLAPVTSPGRRIRGATIVPLTVRRGLVLLATPTLAT